MRSIMAPPMRSRVSSLAWVLLHAHKDHPLALHLLHPQDVVACAHLVADLRRSAQLAEYEAAYGVEVLAFELRANNLVDRPDGDAPVHHVGPVFEPFHVGLLLVELVADLAHDLLDYVLHRHDALEGAPLVYYNRHLEPPLLHVLEQFVYRAVLRDDEHVAHDVPGTHVSLEASGLLDRLKNVLDVNHTYYALRRIALEDGVAGVVASRGRNQLLQYRGSLECDDVRPRNHDLSGPRVLQLEDRLQHVLLARVQDAHARRLLDDDAQLLLRVGLFRLRGGRHAEEAHHGVGRPVEDDDAGIEEVVEEAHEGRDEKRSALRPGDGHALGRELAKDDVQECYRPEGRVKAMMWMLPSGTPS